MLGNHYTRGEVSQLDNNETENRAIVRPIGKRERSKVFKPEINHRKLFNHHSGQQF